MFDAIDTMEISPWWSVSETVRRHPASSGAFRAFAIDTRRDGDATIAQAAIRVGARWAALLEALRHSIAMGRGMAFS
jgi:hypothetical protein